MDDSTVGEWRATEQAPGAVAELGHRLAVGEVRACAKRLQQHRDVVPRESVVVVERRDNVARRFVEQPVRSERDVWTPRRLLAASGISFAVLSGFVLLAFLNHGFPGRLPDYLLPAAPRIHLPETIFFSSVFHCILPVTQAVPGCFSPPPER